MNYLNEIGYAYGITKTEDIVFREEYIKNCAMNYCGQYNKTWSCPPAILSFNSIKSKLHKYDQILVYSHFATLEDNYDVLGMDKARKTIMNHSIRIKKALNKMNVSYMMLGAGSCEICKKCTYPDLPCRYPELLINPMESLGIDVYDLSKKCNLEYYHGVHTVTYFCAILF
ncbi:DUF2284 domain-containing protein [Candidatus Izemoplasma sp. B36]|uniref:DUF2284 domain-containing protein n=1 Tax=Candidatus Izemoplasma sp. B36 TaxID=3242468 RepID=UPI0035573F0E